MKRFFLLALAMVAAAAAGAFPEIPRESYKALGATRGKTFASGLVFVNGKFLAPPYRVERWGVGIRINRVPVTGPVVDWSEFLKTQAGYRPPEPSPTPAAVPPPPPPVSAPAAPAAASDDEDDGITSLDDLFDDDPKPKKKSPKAVAAAPAPAPAAAPAASAVPPPPTPPAVGTFEGPFVKNDAVKALLAKVNAQRTEIDRQLRTGGFICFGDRYSRVVGDARTAAKLIESLPEIQMRSGSVSALVSSARAARLDYLNELLCEELFRNRIDYRALQEHREKLRKDHELEKMAAPPKPLF